ncbi:ETC complex I subunit conserved region-domain-containing protein [Annulohypoxylon maeteangense]|uniref:ETC complex I subunit conserved region-domain-containing protein n=1 Tax=Annulohypoxylon maeteangense TaxID=1927788 RepID=UPI00200801F5|nr:ETC complex I subunit conserved region-domain-containing protein [Annulohypoxylon maeteangense]KAI0890314.1 ETC complex I subunit conserved region-domain-containing protein [Annulohypoxylon maeteangense]
MRSSFRLLAAVKPGARYLEPGVPTGLTGLWTHIAPRSALLFFYSKTLEKLERFPEASLYRQSIEALTRHRLAVVKAVEPPGYAEWEANARKIVEAHPDQFPVRTSPPSGGPAGPATILKNEVHGEMFLHEVSRRRVDKRYEEWDGEADEGPGAEGLKGEEDRADFEKIFREPREMPDEGVPWVSEPQLTADQVEEIENKLGSGLIEEVVRLAENECKLVDIMYENKVWEDLEEKPVEGQWTYFERHATE